MLRTAYRRRRWPALEFSNGEKMNHILLEKAFKYDIQKQNEKLFIG
jgi:hypothetical protein